MTLAERASGRDNNFNLVRLMAAGLVLLSHSWPLTATPGEPLERVAGFSLGHLGVDIFFVVSGFLVTGSLLDRPMRSFLRARLLRIFPALAVNSFGTALVIGSLVTALPLGSYLANGDTWRYAFQNAITWPMGVRWWLPGVFLGNPGGPAVNGALWSLPWELTMYVMLAVMGAVLMLGVGRGVSAPPPLPRTRPDTPLLRLAVVAIAAISTLGFGLNEAYAFSSRFEVVQGLRLVALFFTAGALQFVRERVRLTTAFLAVAVAAFLAALTLGGAWLALYPASLTYGVLWLALVPGGVLRLYNRLGDYSYGFYLWQFPIQQWIVLRRPETSQAELVALAAPATLALAILSWHLIESRALAFKGSAAGTATATVPSVS